jgi:hypothetical protein
MKPTLRFVCVFTYLLVTLSLAHAKDSEETCSLAFKELLQWRVRTLLLGQEAKYRNDCLIETKRKEINKPSLPPRCQTVFFVGSSLDSEKDIKTALDTKNEFFPAFQKLEKDGKRVRLSEIHYRIADSTLIETRSKCQEKPLEPNL